MSRLTIDQEIASIRIRQWTAERTALRAGRAKDYTPRGRAPRVPNTCRFDAALTRCIDFEREFEKLDPEAKSILLLAIREDQSQRVVSQVLGISARALIYKIPQALEALAVLLDKANLL